MDYADLIRRVHDLGGISPPEAERAAEIVVETLGERLPPVEVERLAGEVPEPVAGWLRRRRVPGSFTLAELYDRVHRRSGVPLGFAIEQAQVVCEALAELLGRESAERARTASPGPVAELLVVRSRAAHPAPHAPRGSDHTLAAGRPGSRRPLSEARPDDAHTESVARTANPHAETKLSSSRGLTQERLDETLAAGRPPGTRT